MGEQATGIRPLAVLGSRRTLGVQIFFVVPPAFESGFSVTDTILMLPSRIKMIVSLNLMAFS
jgi:hypothetical protein